MRTLQVGGETMIHCNAEEAQKIIDNFKKNFPTMEEFYNYSKQNRKPGAPAILGAPFGTQTYQRVGNQVTISIGNRGIIGIDLGNGCNHDMKKYVGFSESYKYCTKCDHKENL